MAVPPVGKSPQPVVPETVEKQQKREIRFVRDRLYCAIASGNTSEFQLLEQDVKSSAAVKLFADRSTIEGRWQANTFEELRAGLNVVAQRWAEVRQETPVKVCTIDAKSRSVGLTAEHGWRYYIAQEVATRAQPERYTESMTGQQFVEHLKARQGWKASAVPQDAMLGDMHTIVERWNRRFGPIDKAIAGARQAKDPKLAVKALREALGVMDALQRHYVRTPRREGKLVRQWLNSRFVEAEHLLRELRSVVR